MSQLDDRIDAAGGQSILREMEMSLPKGEVPSAIFNDWDIFTTERRKVFARSWVYLAHESELPEPGDYVLRYIVDDPYIVVRSADGEIRALHNHCRHRGMQVCRSELGNASNFRCPYHGWTYRNTGELTGVPVQKQAYGDNLDKSRLGLVRIAQLDSYNGLIFGCQDPDQMPLDEWLGDIRWYLDLFTLRSPGGLEVIGPPQRWMVDVDWKIAGENFVGDSYHTLMTHRSMVELGQAPRDARYAMYGEQVHIPARATARCSSVRLRASTSRRSGDTRRTPSTVRGRHCRRASSSTSPTRRGSCWGPCFRTCRSTTRSDGPITTTTARSR
jgi:phenylpropionate dioxygenase-like ring-hydroxylating dioxygenase large terminal subunit